MDETLTLTADDATTIGKQTFGAKLKSRTTWFAVVGPVLPFIADAFRDGLPAWLVGGGSLLILIVGFAGIKLEDLARIRAGLVLMERALTASARGGLLPRSFLDAPASGMEPPNPR